LKFKFEHKPGNPSGQFGIIINLKDWKDILAIRFGAEYLMNNNLNLRFSYVYDADPVNDKIRGAELPTMTDIFLAWGLDIIRKILSLILLIFIMGDSEQGTKTSYLKYEGNAHVFAIDLKCQF